MTQIKNYNFSEHEISMIVADTYIREYLWLGFKQDAGGDCTLKKVSAHDPSQVYFDIDITTNEIKKGYIYSTNIYIALDDNSLIGKRYSLSNPIASSVDFSLPAGITEAPVDLVVNGSSVYFLIPGETSGTNAKIVIMTTSGTFTETIDLATVTNAKSFTIDSVTGDIWLCTFTSPATYVRVYYDSGWNYTVHT